MSSKQAYLCNLLSAGLQLLGVIVGVALGRSGKFDISQNLFAFTGGIFLYIGLVDMVSYHVLAVVVRKYFCQSCFRWRVSPILLVV